jgi:hypothetical protein
MGEVTSRALSTYGKPAGLDRGRPESQLVPVR